MGNGLHLYRVFIQSALQYCLTFTHRRRCQPRKVTTNTSGARGSNQRPSFCQTRTRFKPLFVGTLVRRYHEGDGEPHGPRGGQGGAAGGQGRRVEQRLHAAAHADRVPALDPLLHLPPLPQGTLAFLRRPLQVTGGGFFIGLCKYACTMECLLPIRSCSILLNSKQL